MPVIPPSRGQRHKNHGFKTRLCCVRPFSKDKNWFGRCLLCKHEDLSSDSQHSCRCRRMWGGLPIIAAIGRQEQGFLTSGSSEYK